MNPTIGSLVVILCMFGAAIFAYLFCYFLILRRVYKLIDGKLHVRHGIFGYWVDVEEHLKKDHEGQQ